MLDLNHAGKSDYPAISRQFSTTNLLTGCTVSYSTIWLKQHNAHLCHIHANTCSSKLKRVHPLVDVIKQTLYILFKMEDNIFSVKLTCTGGLCSYFMHV